MPDLQRIDHRTIVNLKVALKDADAVANRLNLAETIPLSIGPDAWLLVSDNRSANDIIDYCQRSLNDLLHNAVDYSSELVIFQISSASVRELLAMGSGLDLRPAFFGVGRCSRTRLAQIAVVVVATGEDVFELYLDRSYERYLHNWLRDSISLIY